MLSEQKKLTQHKKNTNHSYIQDVWSFYYIICLVIQQVSVPMNEELT